MTLGDTLITTRPDRDRDTHLWIVVSDPAINEDQVLILNLTTASRHHDHSCVLRVGDHPFITHDSCVNYSEGYVNSHDHLIGLVNVGSVRHHDPMDRAILQRMLDGAAKTDHIRLGQRELLREQGLIPD